MQLFQNKKKWGFTLVEMLIVIVIIGILASALMPRLNSARWRANDTARKAALQQVSAVMVSYSIDHWVFPGAAQNAYSLEELKTELESAWISSIPTDPNATRTFQWLTNLWDTSCTVTFSNGDYWYIPIKKNWIAYGWFILMAASETLWGANSLNDATTNEAGNYAEWCIIGGANYDNIKICDDITFWDTANMDAPCVAIKDSDQLRYIYIY